MRAQADAQRKHTQAPGRPLRTWMATRQARSVPCPSSESPQGQTTPGEMTGGGAKAREQAGKRALDLGAVQLPEIRSKTLSPPSNVAWTDRGRLLEKKKTLGALIIRPQLLTGEGQREEKNWVELPVPQARYWVYSGGVLKFDPERRAGQTKTPRFPKRENHGVVFGRAIEMALANAAAPVSNSTSTLHDALVT